MSLRLGIAFLLLFLLAAVLSRFLTPFEFDQVRSVDNVFGVLTAPNPLNIFGTTSSGFDVFSRVLLATETALVVIVLSVALASLIGISLGVVAGYAGGVLDRVLSSVAEALSAMPALLIALVVTFSLSNGTGVISSAIAAAVIAEAVTFSSRYFRLVRVEVIAVTQSRFVEAARVSGLAWWRLLFVHVLPNSLKSAPVVMTQNAADAVLTLAGLGFLGVGIGANTGAEWGYDLSRAIGDLQSGVWWTTLFPAVAVSIVVVGLMLVGEGLADRRELGPKSVL